MAAVVSVVVSTSSNHSRVVVAGPVAVAVLAEAVVVQLSCKINKSFSSLQLKDEVQVLGYDDGFRSCGMFVEIGVSCGLLNPHRIRTDIVPYGDRPDHVTSPLYFFDEA